MRLLASMGVFKEEPGKRFALTPAGELLKSDAPGTMRYFAMMFGDEWTTRAYEHFTDSVGHAYGGGQGCPLYPQQQTWNVSQPSSVRLGHRVIDGLLLTVEFLARFSRCHGHDP